MNILERPKGKKQITVIHIENEKVSLIDIQIIEYKLENKYFHENQKRL